MLGTEAAREATDWWAVAQPFLVAGFSSLLVAAGWFGSGSRQANLRKMIAADLEIISTLPEDSTVRAALVERVDDDIAAFYQLEKTPEDLVMVQAGRRRLNLWFAIAGTGMAGAYFGVWYFGGATDSVDEWWTTVSKFGFLAFVAYTIGRALGRRFPDVTVFSRGPRAGSS